MYLVHELLLELNFKSRNYSFISQYLEKQHLHVASQQSCSCSSSEGRMCARLNNTVLVASLLS